MQNRAVYVERGLAPELFYRHAVFTAVLYHNRAVFHWIKFPSAPHPKLGTSLGVELVPITIR